MKEKINFTEKQKIDFKIWLVKNHLSIREFAAKCKVSHQYIYKVINGKCTVTNAVVETFKNGGYNIKRIGKEND